MIAPRIVIPESLLFCKNLLEEGVGRCPRSLNRIPAVKASAGVRQGADATSRSFVPACKIPFNVKGNRLEYQSSQTPVEHHAAVEISRQHGFAVLGPVVAGGELAILFYAYCAYKCHAQVFANGLEVPAWVEYCGVADQGVMAWRIFLPRLCQMPSLNISYRILFFAGDQVSCSEWYNAILWSKPSTRTGILTESMDPKVVKQLQRDLRTVMPKNSKIPSTLRSITEVDDPTTGSADDASADETAAESEPKCGTDGRGSYTISAEGNRVYHPIPIRGVPFIME